jgi:hypothetical protein
VGIDSNKTLTRNKSQALKSVTFFPLRIVPLLDDVGKYSRARQEIDGNILGFREIDLKAGKLMPRR